MYRLGSRKEDDRPVIKTLIFGSKNCDFKYYLNQINIHINQFSKSHINTIGVDFMPFEGPNIMYQGWGIFFTKNVSPMIQSFLRGAYFQIIIIDDPRKQFSDLVRVLKTVWENLNIVPTVIMIFNDKKHAKHEITLKFYREFIEKINEKILPQIKILFIPENDPDFDSTGFDKSIYSYFSKNLQYQKLKFSHDLIPDYLLLYDDFVTKYDQGQQRENTSEDFRQILKVFHQHIDNIEFTDKNESVNSLFYEDGKTKIYLTGEFVYEKGENENLYYSYWHLINLQLSIINDDHKWHHLVQEKAGHIEWYDPHSSEPGYSDDFRDYVNIDEHKLEKEYYQVLDFINTDEIEIYDHSKEDHKQLMNLKNKVAEYNSLNEPFRDDIIRREIELEKLKKQMREMGVPFEETKQEILRLEKVINQKVDKYYYDLFKCFIADK